VTHEAVSRQPKAKQYSPDRKACQVDGKWGAVPWRMLGFRT